MGWPDAFTKRAKSQGYAARSVFKLQDITDKYFSLEEGMSVLDLGCFPGSFSQYALKQVGLSGRVVGVDTQKLSSSVSSKLMFIQKDVFDTRVDTLLERHGPFDVVLSDMAPQTTGNRKIDQGRSATLAERAWELAVSTGKPGCWVVIKYFQGGPAEALLKEIRSEAAIFKTFKPKGSRQESYEMFLIARLPDL